MGQRMVRVNELVKRELSQILHTTFKTESVAISITDVEVAPDLRQAFVHVSVFGGPLKEREALRFLKKNTSELKRRLGKAIVLKYMPALFFRLDHSVARGVNLIQVIDEIEQEQTLRHEHEDFLIPPAPHDIDSQEEEDENPFSPPRP